MGPFLPILSVMRIVLERDPRHLSLHFAAHSSRDSAAFPLRIFNHLTRRRPRNFASKIQIGKHRPALEFPLSVPRFLRALPTFQPSNQVPLCRTSVCRIMVHGTAVALAK